VFAGGAKGGGGAVLGQGIAMERCRPALAFVRFALNGTPTLFLPRARVVVVLLRPAPSVAGRHEFYRREQTFFDKTNGRSAPYRP
jgi:hypothetical protein